ncbi:hypothetical protein F5B17DRAFT_444726 [Nemania serpens]|nr:hypothetical protein F5B17DRAFT_444726 [Nemania serpens]
MPSDEQKKDESKVENHVNHDDKPEEPQKDEDTTQDGNEDDVLPIKSIAPSPELRRLLANLCQLEIPADAIQKFEIEPTKDGIPRDQIDVSTITWPPQQDALVREVTERAVEESTLKILQLAAKSKEWNAKTLVLRKGSLVPFPGEISLIVPLIRAHSSQERPV